MQTEGHSKWLASPPEHGFGRGRVPFAARLIQNGSSRAVVTKLATGCLEKCTQAETGVEPGNAGWLQGLCLLPGQQQKVT